MGNKDINGFFSLGLYVAILACLILTISSCEPDAVDTRFEGPSKLTLSFSDPYLLEWNLSLESGGPKPDHEYLTLTNIQKVFCKTLKGEQKDSIVSGSFANWAWIGQKENGPFPNVFATDTSQSISGFIQVKKSNGHELVISIPAYTTTHITDYQDDFIEGHISAEMPVDYSRPGFFYRRNPKVEIKFKLLKGPDR